MLKYKPLEYAIVDLEKSVDDFNLRVFNSEYNRCCHLLNNLNNNPYYKNTLGKDRINEIERYYRNRMTELKDAINQITKFIGGLDG